MWTLLIHKQWVGGNKWNETKWNLKENPGTRWSMLMTYIFKFIHLVFNFSFQSISSLEPLASFGFTDLFWELTFFYICAFKNKMFFFCFCFCSDITLFINVQQLYFYRTDPMLSWNLAKWKDYQDKWTWTEQAPVRVRSINHLSNKSLKLELMVQLSKFNDFISVMFNVIWLNNWIM